MDVPRVGVLTDDLGLVVSLGLRHSGLEVEQLTAPDDVSGHDAVLVDVPHGVDVAGLLDAIGEVPTVVLVGEGVPLPAGVAPVRRPCSLDQLVEAIDAVLSMPARAGAVEPVATPAAAASAAASAAPEVGLFTSHRPRRRRSNHSA